MSRSRSKSRSRSRSRVRAGAGTRLLAGFLLSRHCPLATAHSPLPTAHSSLTTAHCPLPTAHSPLPARHWRSAHGAKGSLGNARSRSRSWKSCAGAERVEVGVTVHEVGVIQPGGDGPAEGLDSLPALTVRGDRGQTGIGLGGGSRQQRPKTGQVVEDVTVGLNGASRSMISMALRNSATASPSRPAAVRARPTYEWFIAR